MWMIRRKSAEELDGILYFLSSALTSVIEGTSYLAQHGAMVPKIGAGLATSEIAARLAMFREQVCDVSQREFMVVTKVARARHWARELRRHEPHLRADIDGFLTVTAHCEAMARNSTPDPESLFDGEAEPKRFLAGRVPGGRAAADAAVSLMERLAAVERGEIPPEDDGPRYLIGGELSAEALDDACERLLSRLSEHYGWDDTDTQVAAEAEVESLPPQEDGAEAPGQAASAEEETGSSAEAMAGDAQAPSPPSTPDTAPETSHADGEEAGAERADACEAAGYAAAEANDESGDPFERGKMAPAEEGDQPPGAHAR